MIPMDSCKSVCPEKLARFTLGLIVVDESFDFEGLVFSQKKRRGFLVSSRQLLSISKPNKVGEL
jgi:hypothetical protein